MGELEKQLPHKVTKGEIEQMKFDVKRNKANTFNSQNELEEFKKCVNRNGASFLFQAKQIDSLEKSVGATVSNQTFEQYKVAQYHAFLKNKMAAVEQAVKVGENAHKKRKDIIENLFDSLFRALSVKEVKTENKQTRKSETVTAENYLGQQMLKYVTPYDFCIRCSSVDKIMRPNDHGMCEVCVKRNS